MLFRHVPRLKLKRATISDSFRLEIYFILNYNLYGLDFYLFLEDVRIDHRNVEK